MKQKDYYHSCAVPKPKIRKRERKTNGYKNKKFRTCFYCHTPYADRHEVYPGANRQISIDEGFQVDLCPACHKEMQDNLTEQGKKRNKFWKQFYQKKYEQKIQGFGISASEARRLWMSLIGRNYLDD